MTFKYEVFPECVSMDASGGADFDTDIVVVNSGDEFRNQNWEQALGRWEVAHVAKEPANYEPLKAHFRNMGGKACSFPFLDPLDNECVAGQGVFILIGSPAQFQMAKRYTFGTHTYDRIIRLPKQGTITIVGVGAVDYNSGLVAGSPTSWTGHFYTPARYDTDQMRGQVVDRKKGVGLLVEWQSIPIVETRDYS